MTHCLRKIQQNFESKTESGLLDLNPDRIPLTTLTHRSNLVATFLHPPVGTVRWTCPGILHSIHQPSDGDGGTGDQGLQTDQIAFS